MIELDLILFGIARDIAGSGKLKIKMSQGASILHLKRQLQEDYPAFTDLASISFAVDTEYVDDAYLLKEKQEVVVIPPVSGG